MVNPAVYNILTPVTLHFRRHIEEEVADFEDKKRMSLISGGNQVTVEVTEKDSLDEQILKKELEVLKIQLDNLEKDHQKQLEALQTKMEETTDPNVVFQ